MVGQQSAIMAAKNSTRARALAKILDYDLPKRVKFPRNFEGNGHAFFLMGWL